MNKKVLLADDSITIQKVVDIIFATENYDLSMTDDGDKALEKAIQEHPDMVIADISMPGKDGFELCRKIKSDPALKQTAVMLLPGAFDHFDEQKAQEVCADGWLTKPFESQALLDKVAQLLAAEPLRLDTAEAETEGAEELTAPAAAPAQDESVTDSTLGLDQVDELAPEDADESAEDIWDAVSFAEEDLQPEEDDEEEGDDAFISAATATVASGSDWQDAEEPGVVESAAAAPEPDRETEAVAVLEETDQDEVNDFAAFSEDQPAEESEPQGQSLDSLSETPVPPVGPAARTEESEGDVDFSRFSEDDFAETDSVAADTGQPDPASEPEAAATSPLEAAAEEDAVFGDNDGFDAFAVTEEDEATAEEDEDTTVGKADAFGESLAAEENQPTDLYAASVAAADALVSDSEDESNGQAIEEEILELTEDDIVIDETEAFAVADNVDQESRATAAGVATEVSDDETDAGFEHAPAGEAEAEAEEDDDFVFAAEEPLADAVTAVADPADEEREDEPLVVPDDASLLDEEPVPAAAEEAEADDDFVFAAEEPLADAVTAAAGPESEVTQVAAADPAAAEDENFYFDVPVEASSASVDEDSAAIVPTQSANLVEQQLRELSEEELQELVAKVAGPLIEKMAGEMLEQIAWEVVPDLAEAMIKEEIRKVKEAIK